jgi:phospholipase D1/2
MNLKGNNVKVVTTPHDNLVFLFSHHQKTMIIDQKIGYVGGIDLCYGRYDYHSHPIFDSLVS